jgi:predicted alpha/beta-fold hydrolase
MADGGRRADRSEFAICYYNMARRVTRSPSCFAAMPKLISNFIPAWWLPGPHLPTIWGKMARRRAPVHDRLERIATPDGDHVTLVRMGTITEGVPHLLLLHGLEGKITAKYAHGMLEEARRLGWSGDMLMFRTCDGEVNAARRFYHSGETTDLDLVVRRLIEQHPGIQLHMCGISLGGNVLLKWLGEQGERVPSQIRRAAAVSVPYDLEAGARLMERGFARVYVRHFLSTLVAKAARKLERYPDLCDLKRLRAARTFFEFDDLLTGPLHGFSGAHDYYEQSSSIHFLGSVRTPTLLMSAWNDPFLPRSVLADVERIAEDNPNLFVEFSPTGGHVGWVAGQPWAERYYMESRVVEWLRMGR